MFSYCLIMLPYEQKKLELLRKQECVYWLTGPFLIKFLFCVCFFFKKVSTSSFTVGSTDILLSCAVIHALSSVFFNQDSPIQVFSITTIPKLISIWRSLKVCFLPSVKIIVDFERSFDRGPHNPNPTTLFEEKISETSNDPRLNTNTASDD